mmetsp:Transcript_20164/g.25480  ORF Transcript_20164/g.25480 Transcript_20164/m.25480 type:complete len:81 (+) Transcript_20164:1039-1281(+)
MNDRKYTPALEETACAANLRFAAAKGMKILTVAMYHKLSMTMPTPMRIVQMFGNAKKIINAVAVHMNNDVYNEASTSSFE